MPAELEELQRWLGGARPDRALLPATGRRAVAACFVSFAKDRRGRGHRGEPAWAAAVLMAAGKVCDVATIEGLAGASYAPGLLALREGALLEEAVRSLTRAPDVLLVNASGRDHPRRAGLALHLGAVLDVATVGVTDRTLVAEGSHPGARRLDKSPLMLGSEVVGWWLRTRAEVRPIAVHAAWRTTPDQAVDIVAATLHRARTPEPLRRARHSARMARAGLARLEHRSWVC